MIQQHADGSSQPRRSIIVGDHFKAAVRLKHYSGSYHRNLHGFLRKAYPCSLSQLQPNEQMALLERFLACPPKIGLLIDTIIEFARVAANFSTMSKLPHVVDLFHLESKIYQASLRPMGIKSWRLVVKTKRPIFTIWQNFVDGKPLSPIDREVATAKVGSETIVIQRQGEDLVVQRIGVDRKYPKSLKR